jgi:opacity protein-like surface antigen
MTYKISNKYLLLGLLGVAIAIFLLGGYLGLQRGNNASTTSISALNGVISRYEIELNDTKTYVTSVEQENKTLKQAKRDGDIEREALKKLHLKTVRDLTKAEMTIEILRDSVKHNGQIITIRDTAWLTDNINCIKLPFVFNDSNTFYSIKGGFNEQGIMKLNLFVPIDLSVWTGIDKKTKKATAIVTSTNPFIAINKIKSVEIDAPKPQKWSLGLQGGYGITNNGFSPYVGIGISRSVLRF